LGTVF